MKKNIELKFKIPFTFLLVAFVAVILLLNIRGNMGNPSIAELNSIDWKENGPLEVSPERGRYALLYSLTEDKSFQFSLDVAKFATPDLGYIHGKYVSLFAPALSFIAVPGYLLGKSLGMAQVGAFAIIAAFGLINVLLIRTIAMKLGANKITSTLAGFAYIFATPAFTYSVTLYQHQVSTFIILISLYALLRWKNYKALLIIWPLYFASFSLDYPNFFLMLPIALYTLKYLVSVDSVQEKIKVKINYTYLLCGITVILPIAFFMWTNKMSYNNPFQLSGTVEAVKRIGPDGLPERITNLKTQEDFESQSDEFEAQKNALGAFKTRNILNGLYIHFLSPDRGMLTYTPIMLLGFLGAILLYKYKFQEYALILSIIGMNIFLYSMWGDPWGGWAFGSRYLIPSYALLSILIALLLTKYKHPIFTGVFLVLFLYSAYVCTAGAVTTSTIPPKVEVLALEAVSNKQERYSYDRNMEALSSNHSKTIFFQTVGYKFMSALTYFYITYGAVIAPVTLISIYYIYMEGQPRKKGK